MSFICHIHNYTDYNQQWNVFSAFNPSKCTHTWSSGQPTLRRPGSSWRFGALLKGLTSVVDNSIWIFNFNLNPQPQVTSQTLYPLGHHCPEGPILACSGTELQSPAWEASVLPLSYQAYVYVSFSSARAAMLPLQPVYGWWRFIPLCL